jgi:hypothetical protein
MTRSTQQERLERAFETLKNQGIEPILVLAGASGVTEWDLKDYTDRAAAVGRRDSWAGAHAGIADDRNAGAHWVDGALYSKTTGWPIEQLWFSFPLERYDIAVALRKALEDQAFYVSHFEYNADGEPVGPGTEADRVRLVLKEED